MASTVLPNGIIVPEKFSRDWYADLYHNWQELDNLLGGGTPKDGTLTIQKNGDTVGTFSANQSTDETINITVPDVNDATLTIQQNSVTVDTFTANSSTDKTVNISVPTKTSDLSNDSGYITGVSWNDVSNKPTFATVATSGSYNDLSNKPTIPTVNDATLTIQQNGTTVDTFTANSSSDKTVNIQCVDLSSNQTVGGNKTFSGLTKTSGKSSYSYSGNDLDNYIYNMETTIWLDNTANRPSTSNFGILLSLNNEGNVHTSPGIGWMAQFGIGIDSRLYLRNKTNTGGSWTSWKEFITVNDAVPRSGGAVMSGISLCRTTNDSQLILSGGTTNVNGAHIEFYGKDHSLFGGYLVLHSLDGNSSHNMILKPDGTWTWDGQAVQLVSDRRLKQQISEIDDKLLDAWQDVELIQFKYNDAVSEKGDKARLHTGFVVQQIDDACKKHGVDISAYGLYCHEEYPQEVEEVEVEQVDGTKVKETKVIREASEHYSLRYTEALIVECKYLRRCVERLTARIEELEKGNNSK